MSHCEVKVVDYRTSNLLSITKALQRAGGEVELVRTPEEIEKADRLVLPGVGAFGAAMRNIELLGIRESLLSFGKTGKPIVGICLGMQLLFNVSYELGVNAGLSLLSGEIVPFPGDGAVEASLKIPHMGWNQVDFRGESRLLLGLPDHHYAYFVHSYYARATEDDVVGSTTYGVTFPAVVERDNIFGIQFHPEKSQSFGLKILENFLKA